MNHKTKFLAAWCAVILCVGLVSLPAQETDRRGGARWRVPAGVELLTDIPYAGTDNPRQTLDLLLPKKRVTDRPLPVIAFIHGGAWRAGDKRSARGRLARYVAGGEYAGVSIGYRLSQEKTWPAQAHDCKAAVRWIRAHAKKHNLAPDRIAVWGSSAGGHLVAMLGVSAGVEPLEGKMGPHRSEKSEVCCVVDFFGPTDFLAMNDFPGRMNHNAADSPESQTLRPMALFHNNVKLRYVTHVYRVEESISCCCRVLRAVDMTHHSHNDLFPYGNVCLVY